MLFMDKTRRFINERNNYSFYCLECFADTRDQCICDKIEGYDAETGYTIVSITEEEWSYLISDTSSGIMRKNQDYINESYWRFDIIP
jgi:DTW domain-containing protein YfiP